jgi:hypothetical protein
VTNGFEDHCWKDVVSADDLAIYSRYARKVFIGPSPALLAIDLYELAYQGGMKPPVELQKTFPSSCGAHAWAAIEPTKLVFAAARAAGIPVFYTTMDMRTDSRPHDVVATKRQDDDEQSSDFKIRPEFALSKGQRSAFFLPCGFFERGHQLQYRPH